MRTTNSVLPPTDSAVASNVWIDDPHRSSKIVNQKSGMGRLRIRHDARLSRFRKRYLDALTPMKYASFC